MSFVSGIKSPVKPSRTRRSTLEAVYPPNAFAGDVAKNSRTPSRVACAVFASCVGAGTPPEQSHHGVGRPRSARGLRGFLARHRHYRPAFRLRAGGIPRPG